MNLAQEIDIGVDVGGTFTDIVCRGPQGQFRIVKVPTTPADPSIAVLRSIPFLKDAWGIAPEQIRRFVHGTTTATNAVIERKGAKIGIVTTAGFRDVLEIGRELRHTMYEIILEPQTPVFLAPRMRRKEVRERIGPDGKIIVNLDEDTLLKAADELVADGVEAIAICLLFSFINPVHERRARDLILGKYPALMISLSCEVDPAFREYERTVATGFDAYIKPVIAKYLERLEVGLTGSDVTAPLQIMQSRGGICAASVARRRPIRLFLSGPAGGVIGGQMVGRSASAENIITADVGGTSCDIALIAKGKPLIRSEGSIAGFPVRTPMVDVNAIGAGGGSIAWLDTAGGLRVGPHSAGSDPGPACYGRGGARATVTDACVVLGYLNPKYFAGGALELRTNLASQVISETIAGPLGMTVEEAALGILRVVNSQMAEGIRLVSIRQGCDPRQFALVPLGGAGPVHATALATELSMDTVIVPRYPGVLSASGLLAAPLEHEASAAFPIPLDDLSPDAVRSSLDRLDQQCQHLMQFENVDSESITIQYYADVCYIGQSYHIEVPLYLNLEDPLRKLYVSFCEMHEQIYGHSTDAKARIVNLRAVHRVVPQDDQVAYIGALPDAGSSLIKGTRRAVLSASLEFVEVPLYDREQLGPGASFQGPAIVEQSDTTILIETGWRAEVISGGNLRLRRERPKE